MSSDLNEALKQFEATEANLVKLEKLWEEMEFLIQTGGDISYSQEDIDKYDELNRRFSRILSAMPKIDGYELQSSIWSLTDIFRANIDSLELGEIDATIRFEENVRSQGRYLDEYRFRLSAKRQELARQIVSNLCEQIDNDLRTLDEETKELDLQVSITHPLWEQLKQHIKSVEALLGNSVKRPARWNDLFRHLHFGKKHDLNDIMNFDWPAVKEGLDFALYREEDPIPIASNDLGGIVSSKPSGEIATALKWSNLTADEFERLIFNIISQTENYENPEWLTHTNAPDKGRDLSVYRIINDPLSGSQRLRVIIACKHYTSKSIGVTDVNTLRTQMELWQPPRVDVLIIATSGRFTADAVQLIEKHNPNSALRIEMWPNSTLERLLAERPHLIAEFRLR